MMPSKVRKMKWGWLSFSLAIGIGLTACGPKTERSSGQQKNGIENFLTVHLVTIQPISEKVSFVSDGRLGVRDSGGNWHKEFALSHGEQFFLDMDEHDWSSFEVVNIKPNSVELKYVSKFDHRSFGRNLITTDEGKIELPFRSKP
jgi:hypothetical protein